MAKTRPNFNLFFKFSPKFLILIALKLSKIKEFNQYTGLEFLNIFDRILNYFF